MLDQPTFGCSPVLGQRRHVMMTKPTVLCIQPAKWATTLSPHLSNSQLDNIIRNLITTDRLSEDVFYKSKNVNNNISNKSSTYDMFAQAAGLDFSGADITRVCKEWEDMPHGRLFCCDDFGVESRLVPLESCSYGHLLVILEVLITPFIECIIPFITSYNW